MPEPAAELTAIPAAGTPASPVRGSRRLVLPRADRREIAAIFAGGALGTLARAALGEAFPQAATSWPWPTFAVNIVAAHRVPAFVAVCDLLHRRGIAGATALLGVDGTVRGDRQRAAFFGRNQQTPSAGYARPGSAAPPRSGASGASTATTRPMATACCRPAGGSPPSQS